MEKDELLAKWLSGEISPEELAFLKETEDLSVYEKIAERTSQLQAPEYNLTKQWQGLQHKVNAKKNTRVVRLKPWKFIAAAAAGIAILFTLPILFGSKDTVVVAKNAHKENFVLPGASSVTLNANSKAVYNIKNWPKQRKVELSGEAFFEVAKGEKFDVQTTEGVISVVGTKFNVKNREHYFEVKCFEGIVRVNYHNDVTLLTKGQTFQVVNNKIIKQSSGFTADRPDWMYNKSQFNSIPYRMVLNEVERIYDINIEAHDIDLNYHFTGEIPHNSIEKALKTLTLPLQLEYEIKEDHKTVTIHAPDSKK